MSTRTASRIQQRHSTIWKYPRLQRSTAPQRGPTATSLAWRISGLLRLTQDLPRPSSRSAFHQAMAVPTSLPRVISNSNAAEMVFTGELINADKALEIGLVSKVVEPTDLIEKQRPWPSALQTTHRTRFASRRCCSSNSNMDQLLELSAVYNAMLQHTKVTATASTWSAEFRHVRKAKRKPRAKKRRSELHHRADLPGYRTHHRRNLALHSLSGCRTRLREGGQISGRPSPESKTPSSSTTPQLMSMSSSMR